MPPHPTRPPPRQKGTAINLSDLDAGRMRPLHRGRNVTKGDVHLLELGGERFAVKDYRTRPAWVRWTVGRWSLGREERAYAALAGTAGVPGFAGRPHPLVLVTRYIEGKSLAAWDRQVPLPERFFARLKETLERVHDHGVVQGDLHHRDVLIGTAGEPWLVDFSTSLTGGARGFPMRGWLWRLLARLDRRAVLKLQERFAPGTLTPAERQELDHAPWIYRWLRGVRRSIRSG